MFRITSHTEDDDLVLTLEGCLAGAWVPELDAYWRELTKTQRGRPLRVDLRDVCHLDESGRDLLARMYRAGTRFRTAGCFMPELVREIAEADRAACRCAHASGRNPDRRD